MPIAGGPYYSPESVTVSLENTLPTSTAKVENVENGGCTWTQNGQKIKTNVMVASGETKYLTCKVKVNDNQTRTYAYRDLCINTAIITNVTNYNGKTTKSAKIENTGAKLSATDSFRMKEYNVVIDKYISDVCHMESREGVQTTYHGEDRKSGIARK